MAGSAFELKFSADARAALSGIQSLAAGLGVAAKSAADVAQQICLASTGLDTTTRAAQESSVAHRTLSRDVAETTAAFGGFLSGLSSVVQQGLAPVNAAVPGFVAHLADAASEVASFSTGMGLLVTPMLIAGGHFGNVGTLAAAAGAAFFIFSSRAAGVRAVIGTLNDALGISAAKTAILGFASRTASAGLGAFSDAVGISSVRTAVLGFTSASAGARVGMLASGMGGLASRFVAFLPTLISFGEVLLPIAAVVGAVYAAVKLFDSGMAAADARLANFKSLEKLSHDGEQAAAALKKVQSAASDTGFSDAAMTKAYVTLSKLKDETLLTAQGLRSVAGLSKEAGKPIEDTAGKLGAVFAGIRQKGDEGQKATRAAIKALQEEGVFSDRARDKIDALQKAHADEGRVIAVVRGEIAQYAGVAERALGTVGGEWDRLKVQASQALGEIFEPLARLRDVLGGYIAIGIHKVADAIESVRGSLKNFVSSELTALQTNAVGTFREVYVAIETLESVTGKVRVAMEKLVKEGLEGVKGALISIEGTLEGWGATFTSVFSGAIGWAGKLISKLDGVRAAMAGAFKGGEAYGTDTSNLGMGSAPGGGGDSRGAGGSWGDDETGGLAKGFQDSYQEALAKVDAKMGRLELDARQRVARAQEEAEKAKADARKRDEDRAVNPKTYPEEKKEKGGGGSSAAARKAEVDQGAAAERVYQQLLDITSNKLALGELTANQAGQINAGLARDYIAQLRALQAQLPKTSEKWLDMEQRILRAKSALEKTTVFGSIRVQLRQMAQEFADVGKQIGNFITGSIKTGLDALGQSLTNLITRTGNWRDSFLQAGKSILGMLIQLVIQQTIGRAVISAVNKAFGQGDTQAANAQAQAAAQAWSPAATSASIASYGVAAGVGTAAYIAALAVGAGAAVGSSAAMGSFMVGGYTGDGAADEPAGIVHKGEFVLPKFTVERLGLPVLEAMRSGSLSLPRPVAGYQNGGLVGGGEWGFNPKTRQREQSPFRKKEKPFHIHYHADEGAMRRFIASNSGRHIVLSHVKGQAVDLGLNT